MSFEVLVKSLHDIVIAEAPEAKNGCQRLSPFLNKLSESSRSSVKRCKERCLEEALQLLRRLSEEQLRHLDLRHLGLLVRLLLTLQLEEVSSSTVCRKVDQMLQYLTNADSQLVFRETSDCFNKIVHSDELLSLEDLQKACMLLENSSAGREAWRASHRAMLHKVSDLFPVLLGNEPLRDGALCYAAVKVCLQVFQLLPSEVAPHVWEEEHIDPAVQKILQALMNIILGQCSNRDTRLLAGTAVAMLINTASESRAEGAAAAAAWTLLQVPDLEGRCLTVGALQVKCSPAGQDGVDRLALSRGLLTCCRPHVFLSSHNTSTKTCLLLDRLFPLVCALCEAKLSCHYFALEVLMLWMRRVKECAVELWKMTDARILSDDGTILQRLTHIIWSNAESPVDGVPELAASAFVFLLNLYKMDCEQFCEPKTLYFVLLQQVLKLPWEVKAKYYRLCALLPYLGTPMVLDHYPDMSAHLLKCLSINHLSPCASEFYKALVLQQMRELDGRFLSEADQAESWAKLWEPFLHEALTSEVALVRNSSSSYLLPHTFQVFPSAVHPLLASLSPTEPAHLHAWATILSSHRAATGQSPWALQGSSTFRTLRAALGSVEDDVRLAALNLLCCSPKTKDAPTAEEIAILREFLPQNLNCESKPFRQHFQAVIKKFLGRIRESCLACIKEKVKKKDVTQENWKNALEDGIEFVEWLSRLPYSYMAPGHSYQSKKTALLLLSAVLETCTDTWSPDKKKGQPPANMGILIRCVRQRGKWDFFSRTNQLALINCLEDSTNEIRELSSELLLRFFPPSFPEDAAEILRTRSRNLLLSPRVQEAQMGALMMKILLLKSLHCCKMSCLRLTASEADASKNSCLVQLLVKELEEHYEAARADMLLAARTKPIHGVLCALQRCLFEASDHATLDRGMISRLLDLLENISLLLLAVLHGERDTCAAEKYDPPSFCDMGNAISSLICQQSDGEEEVLLSEEHSLILTCCWVSLKEIGIFLGTLVANVLSDSRQSNKCHLTKQDLMRASKVFKDILLKCRHWGAVEGCCVGFTKFCGSLLSCENPEFKDIPDQMLKEGLQIVQCPRSASVTRRAAGLPMLIQCVLSAEDPGKSRPLLASSMQTLLQTATKHLEEDWDQKVDLPQVCAVHALQALVRGAGLGVAVLQFAPSVVMLSLALLSSPCWAMRNAALQLYSSLCSRMLGQRSSSEDVSLTQSSMSPVAFFFHYPTLEPFLLDELRGAAGSLQESTSGAKLHLQPSLYPILTLLAQLQPGVHDTSESLSCFLPPLLQLSASPIHSVRVMASKALVAMAPPSSYMDFLLKLTAQLPHSQESCRHNRLHGQLLQIKALLDRAISSQSLLSGDLQEVVSRLQASLWLGTAAQRCPLVRAVYLGVVDSLRRHSCKDSWSQLSDVLLPELQTAAQDLQIGLPFFQQEAVRFLCSDPKWATKLWSSFSTASPDLRLVMVTWLRNKRSLRHTDMEEVIQDVLLSNLKEALSNSTVEYRTVYLAAVLVSVTGCDSPSCLPVPHMGFMWKPSLSECLHVLLRDLEEQTGGPEYLSQALRAASVLLTHWPDSRRETSLLQRWCCILEHHRVSDAPEVLRMASSEALCVAGVSLIRTLRENITLPTILMRLINTGLHLLQDQCQEVRLKAARFTCLLHHARAGDPQLQSVCFLQVNQALPLLLDLLVRECWDTPGTLEALLTHLPQSDLTSAQKRASAATGSSSLYEQDDANVFAEPSVMSAHVLPRLLRMAEVSSQSCALAQRLNLWAQENAALVQEHLTVCERLLPAEEVNSSWLALLSDGCFHGAVCGLFTRAIFLVRLLRTSACIQQLCDAPALHSRLRRACGLLAQSGVRLPSAVASELLQ